MVILTKKCLKLPVKEETNISNRQILDLFSRKSLKLLEMKASQKYSPRIE